MKLLITGASGFLGRRAAGYFSKMGYEVLTPSHGELDILDAEGLRRWFGIHHPQAAVHCAAISDTGLCQKNPEATTRINVEGSVNLAQVCNRFGAKLVFCSSDQVYAGSCLPGPHREAEPVMPGTVYARQKYQAEQLCGEQCPDTVCLRLSWMYAAERLPGEHGHIVATLVDAIQDPDKALTWPVYDRRGITDVEAVVRGLPEALSFPPGVYNFGSGNEWNTYETVRWVFQELRLDSALQRLTPNLQAFAENPRDIRMDGSRTAALGVSFAETGNGLYHVLKQIL